MWSVCLLNLPWLWFAACLAPSHGASRHGGDQLSILQDGDISGDISSMESFHEKHFFCCKLKSEHCILLTTKHFKVCYPVKESIIPWKSLSYYERPTFYKKNCKTQELKGINILQFHTILNYLKHFEPIGIVLKHIEIFEIFSSYMNH